MEKLTEQQLIQKLQEKQDELQGVNEKLSTLREKTKDAQKIIDDEQREREDQEAEYIENPLNDPENVDVTDIIDRAMPIMEEGYGVYYPQYYQKYKKDGKITCPACKKEFQSFKDFFGHWADEHQDKYGDFTKYPQYAEKPQEEKTSQEEIPKEEPKKPLTTEDALKLWMEKKRTKQHKVKIIG
jgi:hypothetical protein